MKKRWLTILLLCCMALTLLPTASYAENDEPGGANTEAAAQETESSACSHEEFQDGVCTGCGAAAFAKLTDSAGTETKYFTTLADAFNAVPKNSDAGTVYTVTLLGSRKLGSGWITINGRRVTLDLGGQTLSNCKIELKDGTELTVAGSGAMNDGSRIEVFGGCKLYVKSGAIKSVSVKNSTQGENGTVYLQGGTIGLSLYKSGDAVLTGGTLTSLIQNDSTAMGVAPSVPLSGIIPVGYALEYADGRGKLPRDTGIKKNDALERTALRVVSCDHSGSRPKENDPCVYCGAENPIYYDLQGGSMDTPNPSCCAGEAITLRSPTRNGYRFTGWSGTGLDGITLNVTIPKESTGERYYTAHWEEKSGYSVRFDTGGGTAVGERTDLKWSEPVLSGVPQPKKAGYVFLGWKCNNKAVEENTSYAELAADDTVMTVTLTAEWRQTEPPMLYGLTADADYCESAAFTVSGEKSIAEVKAGDTVLTADPGGVYTLRGALGKVTVTATDEDGRATSVTVTIHGSHSFGAWSANGDGTHTRICSRDADHTETAGCTGGTATCKGKAVCAVCGEGYGEPGEHHFTAEIAERAYLVSAATCTEAAVYHRSCVYCGENGTESFTFGAPLGHTFGGWVTEKAPTRTEKGEKARVCSACGHRETQEIPALGGSTGGGQTGGNGQTTGGNTDGKTTPDNGKRSDTSGGKADATAAPTAVPKPTEAETTKTAAPLQTADSETAAAEETNTATQPEKAAAEDTAAAAQPEDTDGSGRLWIVLVLSLLLVAAALYVVYRRRAAPRSKR